MVDLELHMVNQRGLETANGTATVALPSRRSGVAALRGGPGRISPRKAVEIHARHIELTNAAHGA